MNKKIDLMVSNARETIYFEINDRDTGKRILDFQLTPEQFTKMLGNSYVPNIDSYVPNIEAKFYVTLKIQEKEK